MKNALIASLAAVAWLVALPASADGENNTPGGVAQVSDSDGINQQEAQNMGLTAKIKEAPSTDDGGKDVAESDAVSPDFAEEGEVSVMTTGTDPKGD